MTSLPHLCHRYMRMTSLESEVDVLGAQKQKDNKDVTCSVMYVLMKGDKLHSVIPLTSIVNKLFSLVHIYKKV